MKREKRSKLRARVRSRALGDAISDGECHARVVVYDDGNALSPVLATLVEAETDPSLRSVLVYVGTEFGPVVEFLIPTRAHADVLRAALDMAFPPRPRPGRGQRGAVTA